MQLDITKLVEVGDKIELLYETKTGQKLVLASNILNISNQNKFAISMPLLQAKVYTVSRGERTMIRYCKKDAGIYEFNVLIVKKIKEGNVMGLEVLRISDMTKSQRREYYRLTLIKNIELVVVNEDEEVKYIDEINQIIDDSDEVSFKGILKDISGGGMRVLTNEPLELGLNVKSNFILDKKPVEIKGIVVRSRMFDPVVNQYDIGVEFQGLTEGSRAEIVSVIFQKQRSLIKRGMGQ